MQGSVAMKSRLVKNTVCRLDLTKQFPLVVLSILSDVWDKVLRSITEESSERQFAEKVDKGALRWGIICNDKDRQRHA